MSLDITGVALADIWCCWVSLGITGCHLPEVSLVCGGQVGEARPANGLKDIWGSGMPQWHHTCLPLWLRLEPPKEPLQPLRWGVGTLMGDAVPNLILH